MRMISKETIENKTVIRVESKWLIFKKVRSFEAQREFPPSYWDWLELPDRKLVPMHISFQLDAWNRLSEGDTKRREKKGEKATNNMSEVQRA